jgi:hypothetical protein
MAEMDWFATELPLLEEAFERRLQRMPAVLAAAARSLPDRLGIRPGLPPQWTARLSPLVVLHPMMQTEGCPEVKLEHARHATVAHLFLLAHAFADDHLVDGQTGLTSEDFVFVKEALLEAVEILEEVPGARDIAGEELRRALRRHHRAQVERFDHSADRRRALSADRAALGGAAGRVLVRAARCPSEQVAAIDQAFDALAVALQWEDDIHDWPRDLVGGQENLLLTLLSGEEGRKLAPDAEAVELELVNRGIYEIALRLFADEIERARALHVAIGNRRLEACLSERRREIENLAVELRQEIEAGRDAPATDRLFS